MRLERYIVEDTSPEKVLKMVETNCSDILNVMKKNHNALWRGVYHETKDIMEMVPRIDRKPRDTKQWIHDKVDEAFRKRFGWRVRSEGVFATASSSSAEQFGVPHMFFPFDGYKFVWSEMVTDLTAKIISYNYDLDNLDDITIKAFAPDEYTAIAKPDFKTGKGDGYWSIEKGAAEVDDVEALIKYYKDNQKWFDYKQSFEIHHVSTTAVVQKAGAEHIIEYEIDGNVKYAYWVPSIHGEDYKRVSNIAAEKMEKSVDKRIDIMMKDYTDKNIDKAMYNFGEITFKCSKYYIVNQHMWEKVFGELIRGRK